MVLLRSKKKYTLIILLVLFGISLLSGGYLLWRVLQSDTVAPTDSDAGGNYGKYCEGCDSNVVGKCIRCQCDDGTWIIGDGGDEKKCSVACESCGHSSSTLPTGTCNTGSSCPACGWPEVAYCDGGKCSCIKKDDPKSGCNSIDKCEPPKPKCPKTKPVLCAKGEQGCTEVKTSCTSSCVGCNNKSKVTSSIYCKAETNTCDTGSWNKKPTGTYKYCDDIDYSALAKDKDGIEAKTITVKLNNTTRSTFQKEEKETETTISETLSTTSSCLQPGTYTLDISWRDKKGATSANCELMTSFTVSKEDEPVWSIKKNVTETCVDEGTQNPKAQLNYTVTIKNTGLGNGKITKIVDKLDSKVLSSYMGTISNGGVLVNGEITWNLSGSEQDFTPSQEKTYTYSYTIPKSAFAKYDNTVTAYTSTGATITANASITADCVILPETAMSSQSKVAVILGAILLFLGIFWNGVMRAYSSLKTYTVGEIRKDFEKRIVKS